jgi:hypothetical protein
VRIKLMAAGLAMVAAVGAAAAYLAPSPTLSDEAFAAAYASPLSPVKAPLTVFHLGHSLVGRDMPAMLAQMVPGHDYASQLGWGATMKGHWDGDVPGFKEENAHPRFEAADKALATGRFDALVVTEMVEIKDAIAYFDSAEYLARWAKLARGANPDIRIYLYETWHNLDDPAGWLDRIDTDLGLYWEGTILRQAMADDAVGTVHVIPGGQVMAAMVREIDAGRVPGLTRREDLFAIGDDGKQDTIHLNDKGTYLIALTHYAVLYGKSPVGLPHRLLHADGTPADAPTPEAARIMQDVVWRVVTGYRPTGVAPQPAG